MGTAQTVARPRTLTEGEVEHLDPYAFFAVLGTRVIHPGDRAANMFVDRPRAAPELVRVCKPGGRVLATEFYWRRSRLDHST